MEMASCGPMATYTKICFVGFGYIRKLDNGKDVPIIIHETFIHEKGGLLFLTLLLMPPDNIRVNNLIIIMYDS